MSKRGTGKSAVAQDILYYHRNVPMGAVICPTEPVSPLLLTLRPLHIHPRWVPIEHGGRLRHIR